MYKHKFSANTGFLWKEFPFLERVRRAATNNFDALEFHDEAQSEDLAALKQALAEVQLPVMSLNVRVGETAGCAAIPGMQQQARKDIDKAVEVANDIGAGAVHVLSGKTDSPEAYVTYMENLDYALRHFERTILIEPICVEKNAGYFMCNIDLATSVINDMDHPRLRIMFDCFHIQQTHGDVLKQFKKHVSNVGHVQIASYPERSEPFPGQLDYSSLLDEFKDAGYSGSYGCEYTPASTVEEGLSWRNLFTV